MLAYEKRTANRGELLVGLHAKKNPKAAAIQLLKSDSELAFQWEVYWPDHVPYVLFFGNAELSPDGTIRRVLGSPSGGFRGNVLHPEVVFYREDQFYLASTNTIRPKDLVERIVNGFRGISKQVCGEDTVFLHQDMTRPAILLQVQRVEDQGLANAEVYIVAIMAIDVFERLRIQDAAFANEAQ